MGETRNALTRDKHVFHFGGLVVKNLDVEILAATPFMSTNDIAVRPAKRHIILSDGTTVTYGSRNSPRTPNAICTIVLRTPPTPTTLWPGNFIEVDLPSDNLADSDYVIEPRLDSPNARRCNGSDIWPPPSVLPCVAGKLRIPNLSNERRTFNRYPHLHP